MSINKHYSRYNSEILDSNFFHLSLNVKKTEGVVPPSQ